MKTLLSFFMMLALTFSLQAQVAINTDDSNPNPSAMLDVKSDTAGILIPRMTASQRDAISSPATGLMVFVTDNNSFYFYNGSSWENFSNSSNVWQNNGNTIYVDSTKNVVIGNHSSTGVFEIVTDVSTNTFTSDLCTGGTASADDSYPGKPPENAFDDANTTYWSNDGNLPSWLQYDFGDGNQIIIQRYRLYFEGGTYSASPNNWTFQASNDGITWTNMDSQTGQAWTSNQWKEYICTNTTQYRYYRIYITDNAGTTDNYVSVNEMEMQNRIYDNYPALFIDDNKTGIGTDAPTTALHVNGSFRLVDGSESNGRILGTSANGTASWIDGSTVNGGGWTLSGNYVYNNNDSIGIGTANPNAPLEVKGRISQIGLGNSVFIGENAGANDNLINNYNTAVGYSALKLNVSGFNNTAIGKSALQDNYGNSNTAIGSNALSYNKGKGGNTAIGAQAMCYANNTASTGITNNTAIGYRASRGSPNPSDNTGKNNTAIGGEALFSITSGEWNTAIGSQTLANVTIGDKNTASGYNALHSTTGSNNSAFGDNALYQNTSGNNNTAIGDSSGYRNIGDGNVFLGHKAGASLTSSGNKLYIDNDDNTTPLVYGDFSSRRIGFGTTNPDAKLDIQSATDEDPLRVRIGTVTKFIVHNNGGISVGTYVVGPARGIRSYGNIEPDSHKGADLGTDGKAWDDIYYDDLHNQGASAFEGRNTSKEIVQFPPRPKQPGSFDYNTERGDVELDPSSLPPGLADDNSLLTDEISSYNYKTNYQQQLLINKQKQEIDQLKKENRKLINRQAKQLEELKTLQKRLEKLEEKMK